MNADGTGAAGGRPGVDPDEAAVSALADLDDVTFRRRWRSVIGRPLPEGLGRALTIRILAYYQQAHRYGDLDRASVQTLAALVGPRNAPVGIDEGTVRRANKPPAPLRSPRVLRPGTLLAREHEGSMHRVMVLDLGFAWNGKTYASLSKVAFAITGTRWNGPRFFGLRDVPKEVTEKKGASRRRRAPADVHQGSVQP